MPKKVLVTGGTGFIGAHLTRFLQEHEQDFVTTVARGPWREAPPHAALHRHLCLDLTRPEAADALPRDVDIIYHLASTADVRFSVMEPLADCAANLSSTLHILEAMRRSGSKATFVLASTVSVVDARAPKPIDERAPVRPTSPYGASKVAAEAYCFAYGSTYGLDTRVVRMFNVYGPGLKKLFIKDIFDKLKADPRRLELMGDGLQVRDYMYIEDVVRLLSLVGKRGRRSEIYNCCSGIPIVLKDLVGMIIDQLGLREVAITHVPSYSGDIREWTGDPAKVRRELDFSPTVPLREGLKRTLAALQES